MVLSGLVVVATNLQFHGSLFKINSGNILVFGATALWGLDNNICRFIVYRIDIARLAQIKSLVGDGILLIFAAFALHVPLSIGVIEIPQIVVLGAVGFGTSLYFFLISMRRIGIVRSVFMISLSSVFGLVFASLLLGELISTHQIIAIVVMLIGIYLISIEKENAKPNNIITSVEEADFKDK
jgi:drug/metabolite transporter (DMT)-like permease